MTTKIQNNLLRWTKVILLHKNISTFTFFVTITYNNILISTLSYFHYLPHSLQGKPSPFKSSELAGDPCGLGSLGCGGLYSLAGELLFEPPPCTLM